VNFGIKASTVRQFLVSSGLPSKKAEQTDEKSAEQLAEIAQNQTLMVCVAAAIFLVLLFLNLRQSRPLLCCIKLQDVNAHLRNVVLSIYAITSQPMSIVFHI
jgi:hypothetical protein